MSEYVKKSEVEDIILNGSDKIDMLKKVRKLSTLEPMLEPENLQGYWIRSLYNSHWLGDMDWKYICSNCGHYYINNHPDICKCGSYNPEEKG